MRGAPVAQDFLVTTLKQWLEQRSAVVERWVRAGAMMPEETPKP